MSQLPTVSLVGGFNQWIKAKRAVRKGEHGLCLWIPRAVRDASSETPTAGELEKPEMAFLMGTVFDISQTDEIAGEQKLTASPGGLQ